MSIKKPKTFNNQESIVIIITESRLTKYYITLHIILYKEQLRLNLNF